MSVHPCRRAGRAREGIRGIALTKVEAGFLKLPAQGRYFLFQLSYMGALGAELRFDLIERAGRGADSGRKAE